MPQDLAALIVEEGAVSRADMDRAVARQSQLGGALDTALLELELIAEGHLLSFLSHASGLPAAPAEAFKEVDARARRVFPAKVAERHRLAPFALDGRELSVVASFPIDAAAIDEIGFMLSLTLVPHVGVEWRVHDLIHRLYGGQLASRLAKLEEAARLAPGKPSAPPPTAAKAALSIEEAFFAAGESGAFEPTPVPHGPPPAPAEEPLAPTAPPAAPPRVEQGPGAAAEDETSFADIEPERPKPTGFGGEGGEAEEPLLAALEQAVDAYDAMRDHEEAAPEAPPPAVEPVSAPEGSQEPSAAAEPIAPAGAPEAPAPAGPEPEPEPFEEPEAPPAEIERTAPPHWTIDDARTALAAARHRDEVVVTAMRYARDFFEFTALFAVTRDAVVGHDALGTQEDERARARGTAIYASDPGIVRTVLETRAPYLGPVARDAVGTGHILDGLWRGTPRTVLLYPILIADRPVAVLYADNGEAPVSARRLGDLLLFLSTVGGVFERIIRSRKKRRKSAPPSAPAEPPPPVAVEPPPVGPSPAWMAPPPGEPEPAASPAVTEPEPTPPAPRAAAQTAVARVDAAIATLLAGGSDGGSDGDPAAPILELALGADPEVASAAREALGARRGKPEVKPIPERLRRALLSGVGDRPIHAARALGALRDVESIPILIQALEGSTPDAAADALAAITLQRFGTSARKWLKWWKENRGRTRAEWLFAALTAPDTDARIAASGELRAAAEPPVRYSPDLPAAELEAAARAWWVWWSRQGIVI